MSEREEQITDLSQQRSRSGRASRADFLEEERERRAADLAFAEGQRTAQVDAILAGHEKRLNAINGSIDRGTKATNDLCQEVQELRAQFATFLNDQRTRDEVEKFRAVERKLADEKRTEAVRRANEKQISSREYRLGVAVVVLMILGLIATVLIGTHVI